MEKTISPEWIADCAKLMGRTLIGKYAHWCVEWDDLPIDETCYEFVCCGCYGTDPEVDLLKEKLEEGRYNGETPHIGGT